MKLKQTAFWLIGVVFLVSILTAAFSFLTSPKAYADTYTPATQQDVAGATVSWLNAGTLVLNIGGQTVRLTANLSDNSTNHGYNAPAGYSKCQMRVYGNTDAPGTVTLSIQIFPANATQGNCQGVSLPNNAQIPAGNTAGAQYFYNWQDSSTIVRTDGNSKWTFTNSGKTNNSGDQIFLRASEAGQKCQDSMLVSPDASSETLWVLDQNGGSGNSTTLLTNAQKASLNISNEDCYLYGLNGGGGQKVNQKGLIGNLQNAVKAPGSTGAGGSGATCSDGSTPDANGICANGTDATLNCGGGDLNWIVCPIITLAQGAAEDIDGFITNTMDIDVSNIFDNTSVGGSQQNGYYLAWNSFRILATGLLIVGGLVMIISQGLGFDFLDAYTVRKVLPRLLVAAIGISLSWPLMRYFIELFDTIGFDIRSLIYAPFSALNSHIGLTAGFAAPLLAGVAGALALGFASLTLILTALLAIFVGFLILVIRQIGVILLIILAPIAIASYVLPNTQRLWKLWRDNFLGLMLMFPIISAFIAIGHAFSAVALSKGGGNVGSTLSQVIGIVAYFAPYFLLPVTFRLATGSIGTIAGFVNDRHRGAFDRLKGIRRHAAQTNWENTKAGNRFKGNNALSRGASNALQTATLLPKAGLRPSRMGANLRTAKGSTNFDLASKFMQENQSFQALKSDDDKLWAVMNGRNEQEVREILRRRGGARFADPTAMNDAVAEVMRVQREGGDQVARIAATRAQATTGTGFNYGREDDDMLDSINRVAGADRGLAGRMLGEMRGATVQSGRVDIGGGGFANQAQALQRRYNSMAGGPAYSAAEARQDVLESVIDSASGAQALYGKPASAAAIGEAHANRVQTIVNGIQSGAVNPRTGRAYEQRDLDQALASTMGLYDAMNQASPQNARAMADSLIGARVADPVNGGEISVYDLATAPTTVQNEAFQQMRRDYGNAAERAAAEAQGRVQSVQQQGNEQQGGGAGGGVPGTQVPR